MKYIAVFKSLSYANRLQSKFNYGKMPRITKTPKIIAGGCSYSVVVDDDKLSDVKNYLSKNSRGFLGLYKEISSGYSKKYEKTEFKKGG